MRSWHLRHFIPGGFSGGEDDRHAIGSVREAIANEGWKREKRCRMQPAWKTAPAIMIMQA
ncbi:hypothetical protein BN439_0464 [Erwinia amylovora Ea644]|nr:hypothetical protein BN439_0464 [Erwinia amylovora Ea644]